MIQGVVEKFQTKIFLANKMDQFMANWESSKVAKAGLIDLLGGEEYKFKAVASVDMIREAFPYCFRVIKTLGNVLDPDHVFTDEDIIGNKHKGRKLSRWMIKEKSKIDYSHKIGNGMVRREIGISTTSLETFFKTFYEKIASLKEEELILSANYVDILSCGHVSGANSCYCQSIFRERSTNHGAYSLAPHIFAQDSVTLIAYTFAKGGDKFAKRVWVHINEARDKFIIGRTYGNWSDYALKSLYREIEKLCGETDAAAWNIRTGVESYLHSRRELVSILHPDLFEDEGWPIYNGDTAAYFLRKKGTSSPFVLDIPARVPCVMCGEDHNYLEGSGMCYDCVSDFRRTRSCSVCGDECDGIQIHDGTSYCPRCAHRVRGLVKTCGVCNKTFTERGEYIDDVLHCSACYDSYYARREEARAAARRERQERDEAARRTESSYRYATHVPEGYTMRAEIPDIFTDHIADAQRYAADQFVSRWRTIMPVVA